MLVKPLIAVLLIAILTLTGCKDKGVDSNGKDPALNDLNSGAAMSLNLGDLYKPNAVPEDLSNVFVPTKGGMPVVNVQSIRSFLASLQAIEKNMNQADKEQFKGALTMHVIAGQYKIQMIAKTYPNSKNVPKFTDLQLLQMTFGDINGLDGAEVIARGTQLAKVLPMPSQ